MSKKKDYNKKLCLKENANADLYIDMIKKIMVNHFKLQNLKKTNTSQVIQYHMALSNGHS